ncbi:MAG: hypothetical protein ACO2PN_23630 [Pyrobaculum sp.]|jgi:hypothetical protein
MKHLDILRKMKREADETYRRIAEREREEKRKTREAARRFRDIIKAEKLYKEWELEYVELTVEDFLKMYGVKPLFKELWHMAEHCTDVRGCYRMLAYLRLEGREGDLQLVREAIKIGVDVEMLITLLYQDKREEAVKLVKR